VKQERASSHIINGKQVWTKTSGEIILDASLFASEHVTHVGH
jgi:hypothetical protein